MLKLRMKQTLALFLCGILVRPMPIAAAPGAALGSVTPRGVVNVDDVRVPGMSALFSGDQVRTGAGSALIQYEGGVRVVLGLESQASFSASRVELKKGQMSFSTKAGGPLFAASTLRIEPIGSKSAADVTYLDHKATVAVTEGSFRVVDPSGYQLASLRAGEARLFEEALPSDPAPAAAAAPPAAPAAPQIGGGGSNRAWLLALGVGIVGTSLGIAALLRASDADDRADSATAAANSAQADAASARSAAAAAAAQAAAAQAAAAAAATQAAAAQAAITAAQAQSAALAAQVTALQAQVAALQASAVSQAQIQALASALSSLSLLQTQISDAQADLSALVSAIAAQGGVATAAQLSQLQAVNGRLFALFQASQRIQDQINDAVGDLGGTISTTRLP